MIGFLRVSTEWPGWSKHWVKVKNPAFGDEPGDGGVRLDSTRPLRRARDKKIQSSERRAAAMRWISRSRWAFAAPRGG